MLLHFKDIFTPSKNTYFLRIPRYAPVHLLLLPRPQKVKKVQGAPFISHSCPFRPLWSDSIHFLTVQPHPAQYLSRTKLNHFSDTSDYMNDFSLHIAVAHFHNSYIGALVPDSGATRAEPHGWLMQFR